MWDQGFCMKVLHSYQGRVKTHVDVLSTNIGKRLGESINFTQLFLFVDFDVMGDAVATPWSFAGVNTVSIALTFPFHNLALELEHVEKRREEFKGVGITDNRAFYSLYAFFDTLTDETLRLYPPVMKAPLRETPPEGFKFGDCYVPGSVTISHATCVA
ncbi:hypothetical protein PMIN06_008843 [Paraphaeosphaeria minitans]